MPAAAIVVYVDVPTVRTPGLGIVALSGDCDVVLLVELSPIAADLLTSILIRCTLANGATLLHL